MARISYQDGPHLAHRFIEIPATLRPTFSSCYVFAFPKSGSVLLNNIAAGLMGEAGIPIVDISSFYHLNGIGTDTVLFDFDEIFKPRGYCYSGFRTVPGNMRGTLNQLPGNKILLVRDPRDMLVSLYYSMKFSHYFPESGTLQFFAPVNALRNLTEESIDRFCISNIDLYLSCFRDYSELIDDSAVKILRYEDFVFDKLALASTICNWFSLDINSTGLNELVRPFDIFPTDDKPHEHIRQVRPGDYKRKLQSASIEILNAILEKFIRRFDYSF
jgi:hypothetical protein